jgi:hypothetical protein
MSREVCKVLCRECPFRRASAPGYLGASSGDPWDFLESFAHGEAALPCHLQVNWDRADAQDQAACAKVCRGSLVMLKNECKLPRDPELVALMRSIEPDRETVFAHRNEFMLHHNNPDLAASFRGDRVTASALEIDDE